MPESIKTVLMRRDGLNAQQAEIQISAAKAQLDIYLDNDQQEAAYNICEEFFGLEPDYLDELL